MEFINGGGDISFWLRLRSTVLFCTGSQRRRARDAAVSQTDETRQLPVVYARSGEQCRRKNATSRSHTE